MASKKSKKQVETQPRMVMVVVPCTCHQRNCCPFERQTYKMVPLEEVAS